MQINESLTNNLDLEMESSDDDIVQGKWPTMKSEKVMWTTDEDDKLRTAVMASNGKNWKLIASNLPGKTEVQCLHRWTKVLNPNNNNGPWTHAEDAKICELVMTYGAKKWSLIAFQLPGRIGKQCRERWHNHLKHDINRSPRTEEDDPAIVEDTL